MNFSRSPPLFDAMNLVAGVIIGTDIYVASSFGASYLGLLSLMVRAPWLKSWRS